MNKQKPLLELPFISRVRRNHGLEHATLHVLSERHPGRSMAGHSDTGGFWIVGDLDLDDLQSAVDEALERLNAGEEKLAIHPNCGTNFATAGIMAGGAAFLAMTGAGRRTRDKMERLPLAMTLATLALVFAQPLGLTVQAQVTTSGRPGALRVTRITPQQNGRIKTFRVATTG
jgi:hypothetical protein